MCASPSSLYSIWPEAGGQWTTAAGSSAQKRDPSAAARAASWPHITVAAATIVGGWSNVNLPLLLVLVLLVLLVLVEVLRGRRLDLQVA